MKINIYLLSFATLFFLIGLYCFKEVYQFGVIKKMYDMDQYTEIIEKYGDSAESASLLHNLGAASYELKEYETSLAYFSGALQVGENPQSRKAYEYVMNLLENTQETPPEQKNEDKERQGPQKDVSESESEKPQEQDQGESGNTNQNSKQEKSNQSEAQEQQGSSDREQQQSENDNSDGKSSRKPGERPEEYKLGEEADIGELSQEEKNIVEQEIQKLKQEQIYNQKYFGKEAPESDFSSVFDSFFGGSIGSPSDKKDW